MNLKEYGIKADEPITFEQIERVLITEAIRRMDVKLACSVLGVGKTTLYRKLKEFGLKVPSEAVSEEEIQRVTRLITAAQDAAEFLSHCVGESAPALGRELKGALVPFQNKNDSIERTI